MQARVPKLPDDVLEAVFASLPVEDMLCTCTRVCQRWKTIIGREKVFKIKSISSDFVQRPF